MNLLQLANKHRTDKGTEFTFRHNYAALYDLLFNPLKDDPINLLEIGPAIGGPESIHVTIDRRVDSPGIAMWLEYFSRAHIFGFDISDFSHICNERFTFVRGDAGSEVDLRVLASTASCFDIVIDDGSHTSYHQQLCLRELWPRLAYGGLYIIEDLHWQPAVYEAELPATPLMSEFLTSCFVGRQFMANPVFSEAAVVTMRDQMQSCALFPSFNDDGAQSKLFVARKHSGSCQDNPRKVTIGVLQPSQFMVPNVSVSHECVRSNAQAISDADEARPPVNSFDVFDTLITRRCVDPVLIFALVEAATGITGFAVARRAAEMAVAGPAMTFDDIHAEVARQLGLDAATVAALKQAEIDAEMAQVMPVAENLARVRDGDLLLSDMYLPPGVIRALLEKAGLRHHTALVVSADGKQSGRVWPLVRAGFAIGRHLGDNPHSDVAMPRRFGIVCEQTRLAEPTHVERWCLDVGLRPLGELIRAARLHIDTSDPLARQLLLVQTQLNFPMLLLASVALHRHAKAVGATRLLFSSRDCHLWHALYDALFPDDLETEYFYTSRRLRVRPSSAYHAYATDRIREDAILVDLCGSGWSSAQLMERLELRGRHLYFLHRLAPIPVYERQYPTPDICRVAAVLGPEREGLDHIRLEMCNYAQHGSAVGMRDVAGVAVPVFDADRCSASELALIARQVQCIHAMIAEARVHLPRGGIAPGSSDIAEIVNQLYSMLGNETCLQTAFGLSHYQEDMHTLAALRLLPPA